MKFLRWQEYVHKIQIDLTSHCNAKCGMCIRNKDGGDTLSTLELQHFDLELFRRIATQDTKGVFISELTLNGNWGDSLMHPNIAEMIEMWIDAHPETTIWLHTNGSLRSKDYWQKLASVMSNATFAWMVVAVDGTNSTHHIYRQNTSLEKIKENCKAFTLAGGRLKVITTLFQHNEHEIDAIEKIAKDVGALEHELRHSHGDKVKMPSGHTIHKSTKYDEYVKEINSRDAVSNGNRRWYDRDAFSVAKEYLEDNTPKTKCPWFNDGEIQIDPFGVVWPCCHVSLQGVETPYQVETDYAITARQENRLQDKSLFDILDSRWFTKTLSKSLIDDPWEPCKKSCGVKACT